MVDRADQLRGDNQTLFDQLPEDGRTLSNIALQRKLGWSTNRYFAVRDALVDAGMVTRGRGRGGTVRRTAPDSPVDRRTVSVVIEDGADPSATVEATIKNELALYEPMRSVIAGDWAKDHRTDPLAVEITALQGRRSTGGTWSRPDITSVEVRTFAYVPGKHLEVVTFEVKAANAITVQAVYEALAHRRAATRSYVLLHVPTAEAEVLQVGVSDVALVARSHGVGVVTVGDPNNYETWEEIEEPRRVEPDPERLDAFIATQLSDKTRNLVSKRLR